LESNKSLGIVLLGESSHFFDDGKVAFKWPFNEDRLTSYEAGTDGCEVSIYAGAADDEVN